MAKIFQKNHVLAAFFLLSAHLVLAQVDTLAPTGDRFAPANCVKANSLVNIVTNPQNYVETENSGQTNVAATPVLDTVIPFLRIAACTPQQLRYEWHFRASTTTNLVVFTLQKNNIVIFSAYCAPQTPFIEVPAVTLNNGDVLQARVEQGSVAYTAKATFVANLNTVYAASVLGANTPKPMATVETVHPRRPRKQQRLEPTTLGLQCLYTHDGSVSSAEFYQTSHIAGSLTNITVLTDSIFAAAIAGKVAYITYNYSYGECQLNDDNAMLKAPSLADVYPNPSEETIRFRYETKQNTPVKLLILDVQGREVYRFEQLNQAVGINELAVDDLPKGIYIYFLENGASRQRGTLVKQ